MISNRSLLCLQNSTSDTNVTNPCYPRNYVTTFTAGHLFDSLCTEGLRPGGYDPDDTITFEGTGDPLLCREKVASLFAFRACQDREICCFDGVYQPKVKGSFVVRAKATERFLCWFFSPHCIFISHRSVSLLLTCLLLFLPALKPVCLSYLRHHVLLFRFLPGLRGVLLHGQRVKPLGQLFPERLQLQHLGFLLTGLESGQCVKRKEP